MSVLVDIADRMYDYSDEEKATEAVALFQGKLGLSDSEIIELWGRPSDPRQKELERLIFEAVDKNGSAKRAEETIPNGISLVPDDS